MSLADLTRNSFQSGVSPTKWIQLVKLFLSSNQYVADVQRELTDSILILFGSYPGEPTLGRYLRIAIEQQVLSIPTFVTTFLQAARSATFHSPATLDILCKVVLDAHDVPDPPAALGSLLSAKMPPLSIFATIHDAVVLLKTAFTFPASNFHKLTASASELLILLVSCASDFSQLSTGQAMNYWNDITELQQMPLEPHVRQVLDNFTFSLSLVLGDDAKINREAQMMHSIQMSLGNKTDSLAPASEYETTTFCLFFDNLIHKRVCPYGSGDGVRPAATLVALLRWLAWPPPVFYTQMLLSCLTSLAHVNFMPDARKSLLWRAFILGRLPRLLAILEKGLESEGLAHNDLKQIIKSALSSVALRVDVLVRCDTRPPTKSEDSMGGDVETNKSIFQELLERLISLNVIDQSFAQSLDALVGTEGHSKAASDAQEAGVPLEAYIDGKLSSDTSLEDALAFLDQTRLDYTVHEQLAIVIHKRFISLAGSQDIEGLSHLCKLLYTHEGLFDRISLHIRAFDIIGAGLAFLDDYDCETVGDPQTAVGHLGDVVLFSQWVIATYQLHGCSFAWEQKIVDPGIVKNVAARPHEVPQEDIPSFLAWFKALFDQNSDGIEDSILRSTKPKTLLSFTPALFMHAIQYLAQSKIDVDTLKNGVSYFLGPLLNWTLVGVIKSLIRDVQARGFQHSGPFLEIISTLLSSSLCPKPVMSLSAQALVRAFSDPRARGNGTVPPPSLVNLWNTVNKGLGLPEKPATALVQQTPWVNPLPRDHQTIREALRRDKPASLDIDSILLHMSPTKFLHLFWSELSVAASMGNLDQCKRLATHVLVIVPSTSSSGGRVPPLMPVFLHSILPTVIAKMDKEFSSGNGSSGGHGTNIGLSTPGGLNGSNASTNPEHTVQIELLASVLSSSLLAAFHTEWAWRSICGEQKSLLGQSSRLMARGLAEKLKVKKASQTSRLVGQRLAAAPGFNSMVMGEV